MDFVSITSIRENKCFTENKETTRNVWESNWQYVMDYLIQNNDSSSNDCSSIQQIGNDMFTLLWTNYSNSNRYYHTTVHIEEMINLLNLLTIEIIETEQEINTMNDDKNNSNDNNNSKSNGSTLYDEKTTNRIHISKMDKVILLLSIYFHDAIYDSTSTSNEEDSVVLFQQQFADSIQQFNPTIRQKVSSYILATKHHYSSNTNFNYIDILLQLFLDIDLSVLGKTQTAYNVYSSLIRSEYIHVPWNIYCTKRIEILQSFLQLSTIYTTKQFLDNSIFEQSARINIQNEIQSLSNGLLPTNI